MTDSVYLNPSFLAFQRNYAISGNYSRFELNGRSGNENWNAAVTDGTNPLVQAGVAYTHRLDATLYHLALGRMVGSSISLGVAGKGFHPRSRGVRDSKFDATISATWVITPMIQTALIVDNIFDQPAGHRFGNRRTVTLGSKFNIDQLLLIYFDPNWVRRPSANEKSIGIQAGAEIPLLTDFYLRGGFFRESQVPEQAGRGDGWGSGAGWIGPKIGLDYSYSRVRKPGRETQHSFGLSVFF